MSDLKHGPLTGPKAVLMAEWNAYYRNEDDEEGQEDGEEAGGETTACLLAAQCCVQSTNRAKSFRCHLFMPPSYAFPCRSYYLVLIFIGVFDLSLT